MNYSDFEIDQYIEEQRIKNEIDDYLYRNIYPVSLNKLKNQLPIEIIISRASRKFPKLSEIPINVIETIEKPNCELKKVEKNLLKIENLLKNIKQEDENKENNNECPICFDDLKNKSYITGSCGHIFCAKCIYVNINHNKHTGKLCPMCRINIL